MEININNKVFLGKYEEIQTKNRTEVVLDYSMGNEFCKFFRKVIKQKPIVFSLPQVVVDYSRYKVIIPLNNNEDVRYFQEWLLQKKDIMQKGDYVRDFDFRNGYEIGTLCNCQPILSENLDYVALVYDYKLSKMVLDVSQN